MNKTHNLTIDDIARDLGVSKTTVSRAISGKGRISAATRQRVQAYIQELNYHPSAAAKGLAAHKSYNIALVLPKSLLQLNLPYVHENISSICEEAFLYGYNVLLCLCTYNESDPLLQALDDRKVDGVILIRTVENDEMIRILTERSIPFATIGSLPLSIRGKAVIEVDHNHVEGCRQFTKTLLRDKSGKAALLGNDLNYIVNQSRLSGFRTACQELGLPMEQTPIRMQLSSKNLCRQAVDQLLQEDVRHLICMDDEICCAVMEYLQQKKIPVPHRVEVSSFSDSDHLQRMNPSVSALHFEAAELGRVACRRLLEHLGGKKCEGIALLDYRMELRQSTKHTD